jgi:Fur family ferric uptake transcriptional regulator
MVRCLGRQQQSIPMDSKIEQQCREAGLKLTGQRRLIAKVLSEAKDHPSAADLYRRCLEVDPRISLSTLYRTLRTLEEARIIQSHDFGEGHARFELCPSQPHDHLIDLVSGDVHEFQHPDLERLKQFIAKEFGYDVVRHRIEVYAVPLKPSHAKRRRAR